MSERPMWDVLKDENDRMRLEVTRLGAENALLKRRINEEFDFFTEISRLMDEIEHLKATRRPKP